MQVQLFNFRSNQIRVVMIDGEPWFVATDVCRVLGLTNPAVAVIPIGADEQSKFSLGSGRPAIVLTESGLYRLIMRSDKPQAKPFQDWVTKDVLPAIRKDGAYVMGDRQSLVKRKTFTGKMSGVS